LYGIEEESRVGRAREKGRKERREQVKHAIFISLFFSYRAFIQKNIAVFK
jgi:hypothetical protein